MDYFLVILAGIMLVTGIIGCLLPVIPGPPLSFVGILLAHFSKFAQFSTTNLVFFGALALVVTLLDYYIPVWGTKKFGGTKAGQWGAFIGMVAGIFVFPPLGIILGPFVGAYVGELVTGKSTDEAFRSGLGSLIGFLAGVGIKLAASVVMTVYFVRALILYF